MDRSGFYKPSRIDRLNALAERCWNLSNIHASSAAALLLTGSDDAARLEAAQFVRNRDRWRSISAAMQNEYLGVDRTVALISIRRELRGRR